MYRAVMSNQINSQTSGFPDKVQVTDSTQVMTSKLVLRVPHSLPTTKCKQGPTDASGYQVILPKRRHNSSNQKPHASKLTV